MPKNESDGDGERYRSVTGSLWYVQLLEIIFGHPFTMILTFL